MSNEYEQPVEPMSRTEDLLRTGTEEPVIAMSEIEKILRGEHIDRPHSRVADLLLQYNPSDILIEKSITENGTYYATADAADGYYKVVVDTPVIPPTVLEHLVETVSTNGTHTFTPGTGVDGFSDASITVNVAPNVGSKNITQNGNYVASSDNLDGYSNVNVNVAPNVGSKNIIENGTYNASSDNLDGYSQVVVDVPPVPITEAGSVENLPQPIASFNNGAEAPITSLKVAIEPQQDLHGYDAPWAGGAGKNKFDQDTTYASYKQSDGSFRITGNVVTLMKNYIPQSLVGQQVTISVYFDLTKEASPNGIRIACNIGGTETESSRVEANEKKAISLIFTPTASTDYWYITYGNTGANYFYFKKCQLEIGSTATSYAPYSNICPISGWSEANVTVADDVETPTVSNVYTIDLDGTRYGGALDVTSGGLTVDRGYVDLGSFSAESWTRNGVQLFWSHTIEGMAEGTANVICSEYKYVSKSWTTLVDYEFGVSSNSIRLHNENVSTKEELANSLDGVQLVYELATPLTIQLTPTAIKSLRGVNNVYANTGNINDLDYIYVNNEVGTLINKTITANGSYCAVIDDNADGYLNVDVNLPDGTNTEY